MKDRVGTQFRFSLVNIVGLTVGYQPEWPMGRFWNRQTVPKPLRRGRARRVHLGLARHRAEGLPDWVPLQLPPHWRSSARSHRRACSDRSSRGLGPLPLDGWAFSAFTAGKLRAPPRPIFTSRPARIPVLASPRVNLTNESKSSGKPYQVICSGVSFIWASVISLYWRDTSH